MIWWMWFVIGFCLLALELFAPSDFFLFVFGLAAILNGLLAASLAPWRQLVMYAVISVILLFALRNQLARRFFSGPALPTSDELTGKEVLISQDLNPGQSGSGELRGSSWQVKNVGTLALKAGSKCLVDSVNGLTLFVSKNS